MKLKYVKVAMFILIATILSTCLVMVSINTEHKQIEYLVKITLKNTRDLDFSN